MLHKLIWSKLFRVYKYIMKINASQESVSPQMISPCTQDPGSGLVALGRTQCSEALSTHCALEAYRAKPQTSYIGGVIVISRKWTVFVADLPEYISDKVKGRMLHISQEAGENLTEKQVGDWAIL